MKPRTLKFTAQSLYYLNFLKKKKKSLDPFNKNMFNEPRCM